MRNNANIIRPKATLILLKDGSLIFGQNEILAKSEMVKVNTLKIFWFGFHYCF